MPEHRPPTVGWRLWRMEEGDDGLKSFFRAYEWPDHATAGPAKHLFTEPNAWIGPHKHGPFWNREKSRVCECGFNGHRDLEGAFEKSKALTQAHSSGYVIGAALMWGPRVEFTEGLRARYATALLLVNEPPGKFWEANSYNQNSPNSKLPLFNEEMWQERLEARCARYNIPAVPRDIAEDWAHMSGDPLPTFGSVS